MNGDLILGMMAASAASAAYNGAIGPQALEARNVPEEHGLRLSLLLRLLRRPRWLAGAALNFLGRPLQTVALLLAPLTLAQPCLAAGRRASALRAAPRPAHARRAVSRDGAAAPARHRLAPAA